MTITLPDLSALALVCSLTLYVLLAGADFGGGIWDLFAFGPRRNQQRTLIDNSLGPVWEANHVWIILALVLLFTGFPKAFASISISLHIPLSCMLLGIVFRGSAFVFRNYGDFKKARQRQLTFLFAITSLLTPIFLGICLGAMTSGIPENKGVPDFTAWLHPFPFSVGVFAACTAAFLAATYLTLETHDPALQNDFRKRALFANGATLLLGLFCGIAAPTGEDTFGSSFFTAPWFLPILATSFLFWSLCQFFLLQRKFPLARIFACAEIVAVLSGWTMAQYPYLVRPQWTIAKAAAPPITHLFLLYALFLGSLILFPSLFALFRLFKRVR